MDLAIELAAAWKARSVIDTPNEEAIPGDAAAAFDIQHQTLAALDQSIAGWKVGAKSIDGPIQGAPLPIDCLIASGATIARSDYPLLGLELEIAFRFGRLFEPFSGPYSEEDVLSPISECLPAIEIVSSRYAKWPAVDKLAQLADLQNHGALICGDAIPYDPTYPFMDPSVSFSFEGIDIVKGAAGNPAGDPRRLLTWVVNHCVARGIAIGNDVVVTTGSYTGMHFPEAPGKVIGKIAGLPPIELTLK